MSISLDEKNDAPQLASAVIAAFKKLTITYTDEKLKELFTPDSPENQKLIKEAIEGIKKLADAGLDPKGSNIKVGAVLSFIFPNKEVLGKLFPAFMARDFKALQAATKADFDKRKVANQNVLSAATALQTQLSTAMTQFGKLNTALAAAVPPPAEVAPTRETIFASITAVAAEPAKWTALAVAIGLPPTTAASETAPAVYAPPGPTNKDAIMIALKTAVDASTPAAGLEAALTAIDPKLTVDAVKAALTAPMPEAFIRSLDLSKKLYEAGFITRSEYTGKLLETRSLLTEETLAPAVVEARGKLGQLVAACGNPTGGFARLDFAPLVTSIESSWKKYVDIPLIVESHRRLVKAQVKHRILREAKRQGVKKEMLNEFLLAILGGIIAAVAGWIGKKFGEWFKGGPAVSIVPVGPGAGVSHSKEDADQLAYYAALEEAYQDLKGEHSTDGKSFNRDTAITKAAGLIARLNGAQSQWAEILTTCPDTAVAAAAYPPPGAAAVLTEFTAAKAAGATVNVAPLNTALTELMNYFRT